MRVALDMTETEFIAAVEDAVRPADSAATVIPMSGSTSTRTTTVETFTVGIVSSMEKRTGVFAVLMALVKPYRELVTYDGWTLATDKVSAVQTDFSTALHTVTAKLHPGGC